MNLSLHASEKNDSEWRKNVAGAFQLDQPKSRWEDVVDYNECVIICQDTPEKGLVNIKADVSTFKSMVHCTYSTSSWLFNLYIHSP